MSGGIYISIYIVLEGFSIGRIILRFLWFLGLLVDCRS